MTLSTCRPSHHLTHLPRQPKVPEQHRTHVQHLQDLFLDWSTDDLSLSTFLTRPY